MSLDRSDCKFFQFMKIPPKHLLFDPVYSEEKIFPLQPIAV